MWRSAGAILLLLGACTTAQDAQRPNRISSLIGADEPAVIRALGPPDSSFQQGPLRVLEYDSLDVEELGHLYPFQPPIFAMPGLPVSEGGGFQTAEFNCRVTFTLEAGIVRSFDRRGAGCS